MQIGIDAGQGHTGSRSLRVFFQVRSHIDTIDVSHLVPVNRGIISTIYVDLSKEIDADSIASIYQKAYGDEPFVRLLGGERFPDTKNVSGTNFIDIAWRLDLRTGRAILMSAIDNIVKGASGQAIQCFNLMRGYPETTGLQIP